MGNDIDLSGFDEELNASNEIDLSGFDQELSTAPEEESNINSNMSYLPAAAMSEATAKVGTAIPKIADTALTKTAAALGPFTEDQLNLVKQNREQFKTLDPQSSLSKMEESFRGINRNADELGKQAYANLEQGMSPQQWKQMIGETSTQFSRPVDLTDPTIVAQMEAEESAMARQFAQEAKSKEQASSIAQAQRNAAKKANEAVEQARMANMGSLPEETANAIRQSVMEQALAEKIPAVTPSEDMLSEFKSLKERQAKIPQRMTESLQSPLAKEFPQLQGRVLTSAKPSEFTRLQSMLPEGTTPFTGEELWQKNREILEEAYNPKGEVTKEVAKALGEKNRAYIADTSPEASELFKKQSAELSRLKELQRQGLLSRKAGVSKHAAESVQVGENEAKKLFQEMLGGKLQLTDDVQQKIALLKETVDPRIFDELKLAAIKAAELDPSKAFNIKPFEAIMGLGSMGASGGFTTLPVAAYTGVKYAKTPAGALKVSDLVNTVSDMIPQGVKTGAKLTGKILSEVIPPLGAGVGATMGMLEAKKEGFNPWEAAAYSAFEAVNPIPVSGIEMAKQYQKGTQAVSKANISDYKQQFRTPDYTFKSTDTGNMQNLSDRLAEFRDNKAAQGWSQELTEASQQSDSQKEATLYRLNQLKEFRALVRKTKGIKE
jgi:hypothetical protein